MLKETLKKRCVFIGTFLLVIDGSDGLMSPGPCCGCRLPGEAGPICRQGQVRMFINT